MDRSIPESIDPSPSDASPQAPRILRLWTGPARWVGAIFGTLFRVVSLVILLAISLTFPVLSVFFLGYLVYAQGRAVRFGIWHGMPGLRLAGRIGLIGALGALLYIPVWIVRQSAADAGVIAPGSPDALGWHRGGQILLLIWLFQWVVVLLRGGQSLYWFRPLANLGFLARGMFRVSWYRQRLTQATGLLSSLGWQEVLSLGVRSYLGTMAWLILPSLMLWAGPSVPIVGIVGGILLAWCTLHLPIMQVRLAVEDRWNVFRELRETRLLRKRAPVAMLLASLVWLLSGIPLYLLLIEPFAKGLWWMPAMVFVVLLGLGRWVWSLAVSRGMGRNTIARWPIRAVCWTLSFLLGLVYAGAIFLTPYILFRGYWGLFEHHALLFPVIGSG
jgi:hypothetical protein